MTDQPVPHDPSLDNAFPETPEPSSNQRAREPFADGGTAEDLLQSLRTGLKLQGKNLRDFQQSMAQSLQRIEQRLASTSAAPNSSHSSDDARRLAETVIEMEEGLRRVIESLNQAPPIESFKDRLVRETNQVLDQAGWVRRYLAGPVLKRLQARVAELIESHVLPQENLVLTSQGLGILLSRIHSLMERNQLVRVDVVGHPFDAETMHALGVVAASEVPRNHVAEQVRPLYLWRKQVLRFADVRLSR